VEAPPRPREVVPARRLASSPPLVYPALARASGWEGTAWIRATVEPDGGVLEASVERSSGFPLLDEAALSAVRSWRFAPATAGGVPVRASVVQPVAFRLR
jgi:protein TonB